MLLSIICSVVCFVVLNNLLVSGKVTVLHIDPIYHQSVLQHGPQFYIGFLQKLLNVPLNNTLYNVMH